MDPSSQTSGSDPTLRAALCPGSTLCKVRSSIHSITSLELRSIMSLRLCPSLPPTALGVRNTSATAPQVHLDHSVLCNAHGSNHPGQVKWPMVVLSALCASEKCELRLATSSSSGCHGVTVDQRASRRLCGCYTVPAMRRRGEYKHGPG